MVHLIGVQIRNATKPQPSIKTLIWLMVSRTSLFSVVIRFQVEAVLFQVIN